MRITRHEYLNFLPKLDHRRKVLPSRQTLAVETMKPQLRLKDLAQIKHQHDIKEIC